MWLEDEKRKEPKNFSTTQKRRKARILVKARIFSKCRWKGGKIRYESKSTRYYFSGASDNHCYNNNPSHSNNKHGIWRKRVNKAGGVCKKYGNK